MRSKTIPFAAFIIILTTLMVAFPSSLSAGTRSCTSGMVTLNICRSTSDVAYTLAIGTVDPDGAGPQVAPSTLIPDAFASLYNWQSPAACTQDMVTAGICASSQLGVLVPITKAQFADLQVRAFIVSTIRRYLKQQQVTAAQVAADAAADPDLGN